MEDNDMEDEIYELIKNNPELQAVFTNTEIDKIKAILATDLSIDVKKQAIEQLCLEDANENH